MSMSGEDGPCASPLPWDITSLLRLRSAQWGMAHAGELGFS